MLHVHCQSHSLFYLLILISEICARYGAPHFVCVSILLLHAGTLPFVLFWNTVWLAKFHTHTKHAVERSVCFKRRENSRNIIFVSTTNSYITRLSTDPFLHWLYLPHVDLCHLRWWKISCFGNADSSSPPPHSVFFVTVVNPSSRADVLQQATTAYFPALFDPPCLKLNNFTSWYVSTWNKNWLREGKCRGKITAGFWIFSKNLGCTSKL